MAFRGDSTGTYTYASGSTGGTVDLGARNNYRYVNATNVYNKGKSDGTTTHTQTYTFAVNDTGGTKDLGVNHAYRYVNASNVYNKGKSDGKPKTIIRYEDNISYYDHTFECAIGDIILASVQITGSYTWDFYFPNNKLSLISTILYANNAYTEGLLIANSTSFTTFTNSQYYPIFRMSILR